MALKSKKKKEAAPEPTPAALVPYIATLEPVRMDAMEIAADVAETVKDMLGRTITSQEHYVAMGEVLREIRAENRKIEAARKAATAPLNAEVKRINDWYRPATDGLARVDKHVVGLLSGYIVKQREEEARLMLEAEKSAKQVLQTKSSPDVSAALAVQNFVDDAAAAMPPKIAGLTPRPSWEWRVVNLAHVEDRFLKVVVDEDAVAAWVSEHGDKDVPSGIEVTPRVDFTSR